MNGSLALTLAYLRFHRWKTILLVSALTLTLFLPLMLHRLIQHTEQHMAARAEATPMIAGAKGDRYDLVVNSLYFTTGSPDFITYGETQQIIDTGQADAFPLHVKYTARKKPVVGITLDYFKFRGLKPARGTLPLRLGDCVLGAGVAVDLDLEPGEQVLTDQTSLFNIAASYPLKLRITGILQETGTPDDQAIFVDLKTAWVIEGYAHGHDKVEGDSVLEQDGDLVRANASVTEYNEITDENINEFHLHGDTANLPISSIIIHPHTTKDGTLLKAEYNRSETRQMLVSTTIIEELLGMVFRVKRFFDASFGIVCIATALFIILIILLSLRIRKREMETMYKIGCSRGTMVKLQLAEWSVITLISLTLAAILAMAILRASPAWKLMS